MISLRHSTTMRLVDCCKFQLFNDAQSHAHARANVAIVLSAQCSYSDANKNRSNVLTVHWKQTVSVGLASKNLIPFGNVATSSLLVVRHVPLHCDFFKRKCKQIMDEQIEVSLNAQRA